MEFRVQKKENENIHRYPTEDVVIGQRLRDHLQQELGDFLIGMVVFGSSARRESTERSDIDVLVLTDDVTYTITEPLVEAYRFIIDSLIKKISMKLHVTSMTFTSFWEHVKAGDPVVVNILRDGHALFDKGFFEPLQKLLKDGRIRPSEESIWRYFGRAPMTLQNSRWHILQAALDLYWSVIDSAHAALMRANQLPPTPEHVADLLDQVYVRRKMLEKQYVETMRNFYALSRKIMHREVHHIDGKEYDLLYREADAFVRRMKVLIDKGSF